MKYLVALSLLLMACAKEKDAVDRGWLHYEVREAVGAPRGRFYFIHGYGITIETLKTPPYSTIGDTMHAQGFEVVYIGWPELDDRDMTNNGRDYVATFQTWILSVNTKLNTERPVGQLFVGGASMGGWHSVLVNEVLHADVMYIHEPVTRLSVIRPFAHSDTSFADLQNRAIPNPARAFWVSCGTADYGVDWRLTRDLYNTLPSYKEYPGLDHAALQPQYDDITAWLVGQIL